MAVDAEFLTRLPQLRLWDGSALPEGLRTRLQREFTCWQFVHRQILELEAERRAVLRSSQEACIEQVRQLLLEITPPTTRGTLWRLPPRPTGSRQQPCVG
jgi:hypothetical protein